MLAIVSNNKLFYTQQEIKEANKSRKTQQIIEWPITEAFKTYIKDSLLHNLKITSDDSNIAEDIYGNPVPILQVKIKITTQNFVTKHLMQP